MPHDVKLNGIYILGGETDKLHADALFSIFTDNTGTHIKSCPKLFELEAQGNFLAELRVDRRPQKYPAFANVHALQSELLASPLATHLREERQTGRMSFSFPTGGLHCRQYGADSTRVDGLGENEVDALSKSYPQGFYVVRSVKHHDGSLAISL